MSAPLGDRNYRALATFRHALRVFERFSEDAARAEGLPPAQHQLLLAVRGFSGAGAPTVRDLAELLQTRPHSVLGLLDRAEQAGLVQVDVDAHDARRRRVSLSPAGTAVLARLSALHRAELRRFRDEMADVLRELD